jgi:hypothetical protein
MVIAVGLAGCEIDESRLEPVDDDEFRADGCGANRHKEVQSQTCKFKGVVGVTQIANWDGSCIPNDANHIVCTYYPYTDGCKWSGQQTAGTCTSDGPGIPGLCVPPAQGPNFTKSYTLDLPTGSMLCDPQGSEAQLGAFCWANKPATVIDDLKATCTANELVVEKDMTECCVDDAVDDTDAATDDGSDGWGEDEGGGSTWDVGESSGSLPDETPDEPVPLDVGSWPLPIPE